MCVCFTEVEILLLAVSGLPNLPRRDDAAVFSNLNLHIINNNKKTMQRYEENQL